MVEAEGELFSGWHITMENFLEKDVKGLGEQLLSKALMIVQRDMGEVDGVIEEIGKSVLRITEGVIISEAMALYLVDSTPKILELIMEQQKYSLDGTIKQMGLNVLGQLFSYSQITTKLFSSY